MRTGRVFLAGALALGFCFALAGRASAQVPPPSPSTDFQLSNLSAQFTFDFIGATPVSCVAMESDEFVPSDSYHVKAKLKNIGGDFTQDLTNNRMVLGFAASCSENAINAFLIPPGAVSMKTLANKVVQANFEASVPDGLLGVYGFLDVTIMYNPTAGIIGWGPGTGLQPKTGNIAVEGSADLCPVVAAAEAGSSKVCLFLDLSVGPGETPDFSGDSDIDIGCVCATPTISSLGFNFDAFLPSP